MDMRQIKAIETANKKRILEVNPNVPEESGIYFFLREESGIKYAYVGQARNLLSRLAGHLSGYQHIDVSIKKHGLIRENNPCGWDIQFVLVPVNRLDEEEQAYIKAVANRGYQLRNHTTGSQGKGKTGLDNQKAAKGYRDGLQQGYKNAQKFVANLFEKHLDVKKKSDRPNKNQDRAMEKFLAFLEVGDG